MSVPVGSVIQILHPDAHTPDDFLVDGDTKTIEVWNVALMGPQKTYDWLKAKGQEQSIIDKYNQEFLSPTGNKRRKALKRMKNKEEEIRFRTMAILTGKTLQEVKQAVQQAINDTFP